MEVKLQYFMSSGKWKYKGGYKSEYDQMWKVFNEVEMMKKNNELPGLSSGSWNGFILIDSPDGYPGLIKPN